MTTNAGDGAGGADAVLHRYYRLLPAYITPESVEGERGDLIHRVEVLSCSLCVIIIFCCCDGSLM